MGTRFLLWFTTAFAVTLVALGGIGLALAKFGVSQPRELYRNAAFEFDLAPGWWCENDGTEDVCLPSGQTPTNAMGAIAIKYRGPDDNLEAYETYLRKPQEVQSDVKPAPLSEIRYVRRTELSGRTWVESLHVGSALKNYNTYYMATATSHVGILVTLSMHKDYEDKYITEFTRMMKSLKTYQH